MRSSVGVCVAAALLAIATGAARVEAQACCGGATAVSPGRLTMADDFLVGGLVRVQRQLGNYDEDRTWARAPSGSSQWDAETDLFATARFARHGQVTLVVPFLESWRKTSSVHSQGGGFGDVRVAGRWDFTRAGASRTIPGIALLAGVTFPTGRPWDRVAADDYLAAGETGRGVYTGSIGVAVEQTFGRWLVLAQALISHSLDRRVELPDSPPLTSRLGTAFTATGALAYAFDDDSAIGGFLTYDLEGDNAIDGEVQKGTGRALTTVGFAWAHPLSDAYRLQGTVTENPPVGGFGRNRPGGPGLSVTFLRAW